MPPIRIEKTFQVREPIEKVWEFLSNPRKVVTCVPGAQITQTIDERTYKGAISVKVGPSVTDYKGEVHIERLDAASHEIELVGKGQDVRGKGSASMKMTGRLRALPDGATEVVGASEVNVVGVLAQFGSRMINDVSDLLFEEFTKTFRQQLQQVPGTPGPEGKTAAQAKPLNAVPLVFSALRGSVARFWGRIFGGSAPR